MKTRQMTVAQLIEELKNQPKNSFIGWRAHDNAENELSGIIEKVDGFSPNDSFDKSYCKNVLVVLS